MKRKLTGTYKESSFVLSFKKQDANKCISEPYAKIARLVNRSRKKTFSTQFLWHLLNLEPWNCYFEPKKEHIITLILFLNLALGNDTPFRILVFLADPISSKDIIQEILILKA